MMSYVGDTTAIVSTAADGSDGGEKVPYGATSVGDGGDRKIPSRVGVRVSFRDLKKIPTRERSTARKRTKPQSSTLTSDEHFEFLSKSTKQPRTSKDKRIMVVSAAVARGGKKRSCRSTRKRMLRMIHLAVCVERNTMIHQQMNGSSALTVNVVP